MTYRMEISSELWIPDKAMIQKIDKTSQKLKIKRRLLQCLSMKETDMPHRD